jgi:PHP family Zn ribbon phosphoesterase
VGSLLARGTAVGQGKAERNLWEAFWKRYHNALELLIAAGEQLNKLGIANLKRI